MCRNYLLAALLIISPLLTIASGNWRIHPSFDGDVNHVIETSDYVYFTSRTIPEGKNIEASYTLFRYDKEGDELQTLSTDNILSYNTIQNISYNPKKNYVVVVYSNYDIDLIHDNGKIDYIPYYRLSSPGYSKKVNSITINPEANRIYLATDFGYVSINDEKAEIAESRIYGEPLKSVSQIGQKILLLKGNNLLEADVLSPRMSLADYNNKGTFSSSIAFYPLSETEVLMLCGSGNSYSLKSIEIAGNNINVNDKISGKLYNIENNKNGVTVPNETKLIEISSSGDMVSKDRPQDFAGLSASSFNLSEIWHGGSRMGLASGKPDGNEWTVTRDFMLPDSPAPFISTDMKPHPTEGFMLTNYGYDYNLGSAYPQTIPVLLSTYKYGRWQTFGPAYENKSQEKVMTSPSGFDIDPDNPNLIYLTSKNNGLLRLNLDDPDDIIHLSHTDDGAKNLPGFVSFFPVQTGSNKGTCRLSAPRFDSNGNLWMSYAEYDNQASEHLEFYCWEAADRKNTSSSQNISLPKKLEVRGFHPTNVDYLLPLRYTGRKNWLAYAQRDHRNNLVIIDTGGTPTDSSDDIVAATNNYMDQDGNTVEVSNIRCLYEDPSTGLIWVGHQSGVFYFNPSEFLSGNTSIRRVKVARNDGTNLADYLLNEVTVNNIVEDGRGRKWFATNGGGVVCTSSDGREIELELTKENSDLPDNVVFGIGYNRENNSMFFSTSQGIAEYFISGSNSSGDKKDIKAYPNPVRPDYIGYVTIEDLPSDALVKIADASGNVVKELGKTSGSEVKWDITNLQFKRVSSGVYYILVSSASENSFKPMGKILVIN